MTFIDFFAGIGGFHIGMEQAGHKCIGFCEADKFAIMSYTSMHCITEEQRAYLATLPLKERQKEILKEKYRNGLWFSDDVCGVDAGNVPKADCWCYGSPCQSFSVAGKREGLDGASGLVREIFRILSELKEADRPEWLVYENVKGMFTSNRGFDFLAILLEMDKLGYDCEWQLFNSKYCGVPQNRERVYVIGHLRSRGSAKIFPLKGSNKENSVCNKIDLVGHRDGYRRNTQVFAPDGITETLSTCCGGGEGASHGRVNLQKCRGVPKTLKIADFKNPVTVAVPVLTPERAEKRQNGRRFKEKGEEMFTLTAQDRHGVAISVSEQEENPVFLKLVPVGGVRGDERRFRQRNFGRCEQNIEKYKIRCVCCIRC